MARFKRWRARASQIGYYVSCSYRAAFDRALQSGEIVLPPEAQAAIDAAKVSSPNADLGTVIHFLTQVKLGVVFPGKTEEHCYTPEQLANAAALFDGNVERCMAQAKKAADRLVESIGTAPSGTWHAEHIVSRPWITGHIDLVDFKGGVLRDIKTTSKPPYYTHIPPTHLAQVLAYVEALAEEGVEIRHVSIDYIDAQASQWWLPCPINPTCEEMLEYRGMVKAYAKKLQKKTYMTDAVPNLGDPCEKWCPYVSLCRDRYSIKKGEIQRPPPPTIKTSGSPLLTGTAVPGGGPLKGFGLKDIKGGNA